MYGVHSTSTTQNYLIESEDGQTWTTITSCNDAEKALMIVRALVKASIPESLAWDGKD